MTAGTYITYSEAFDKHPTLADLVEMTRVIPLRHGLYVLARINLALRYAQETLGREDYGRAQEFLMVGHLDDEVMGRLKERFPAVRVIDRPVFITECVLGVIRLLLLHSNIDPDPTADHDEDVRHAIGRACLMMNDLLVNDSEKQALLTGSVDDKRVALMIQAVASFEIANSQAATHLIPRLHVMFRVLLSNQAVTSRISHVCDRFNFEAEFQRRVGLSLDRWLAGIFSLYAYFMNSGDPINPNGDYMLMNPAVFPGQSGMTGEELQVILGTVGETLDEIKRALQESQVTDFRRDFTAFRSKPLLTVEPNKVVPTDLAFVVEKCHTGVHWTLHDKLTLKERRSLFRAWGILFEEYVHWLFSGMRTRLPVTYIRNPEWLAKKRKHESFDGVLLQGGVLVPIECKGGFLSKKGRYPIHAEAFLTEIASKFGEGCDQLADKIGKAFASDTAKRLALEGVPTEQVRAVVPVLVFQDHVLRVPFLNWHLNKRFQTSLARQSIRHDVVIRPLTVAVVHDLEDMVYACEGGDFDFIYALQHRVVRDTEALSMLRDVLELFPEFRKNNSERRLATINAAVQGIQSYLFPGEPLTHEE